MNKQKVYQLDVNNKKVIVRVDLNVPFKDKVIQDNNRIVQALPTIKYLIENNAKVILLSHLGKVKHKDPEKAIEQMKKNNLEIVVGELSKLLGQKVKFVPENTGELVEKTICEMEPKEVVLLQNTRYQKGEEKNCECLSKYWASLCDIYVNDAFGSCHRAHASTYGIPSFCNVENKPTAVGYLVEKEIEALSKCVEAKDHPYVAILGGSKVSDKIKVIEGLLDKADKIIIGGAMAYTFLKAQGYKIGNSLCEDEQLDFARLCLEKGKDKICLPIDHVISNDFVNPTEVINTEGVDIKEGYMGVDVGIKTNKLYKQILEGAKVVFWNGPLGAFENPLYANGTKAICEAILSIDGCFSVVGGGDSASAAAQFGYAHRFNHVSTGGGASLEMIENNGHLPGIDIIKEVK